MKKIIIAVLIATLTLSMFAACGTKPEESAATTSAGDAASKNELEVPSKSGVEEFKNAEGKVVYKVEYTVPWLDETYSKEAQTQFNNLIESEFLNSAFADAERNVENVRDTETEPRTIKVSFKPVYKLDNILSLVISTAHSSASSIDVYRTFNLDNGFALHVEEFFTGDVEETKQGIFDALLEQALPLIPENSEMTSEERSALAAEKLVSGFNSANFYITDSYVAFVYYLSAFKDGVGKGAGTHEFVLDLNTYAYLGISNNPEEVLK